MTKKLLLISLIILLVSKGVSAQEFKPRLGVSPHTFELDVNRGEVIQNKIKVVNQSEVAIPITTRITDFTAAEETGQMLFDETSQDPSFASRKWIKIENPNFILAPGEVETVKFSIEVPENAEPGGHYAVVIFEPQLPSYYFKEGQARAIPTIGVLFLFSVKTFALEPEIGQRLEAIEFSLPKEERLVTLENFLTKTIGNVVQAAEFQITEKSPSQFILRIKNNDIYHLKPSGKISIFNFFGKKVGEVEIEKITILPGKIRQIPVNFRPEIPQYLNWLPASLSHFLVQNTFFGKYTASLGLTAENAKIEEVIDFWTIPWKIGLPLLLLFVLIMFFLIEYRKRIKLAIKVLFKK